MTQLVTRLKLFIQKNEREFKDLMAAVRTQDNGFDLPMLNGISAGYLKDGEKRKPVAEAA
jgi:hypothetical protein